MHAHLAMVYRCQISKTNSVPRSKQQDLKALLQTNAPPYMSANHAANNFCFHFNSVKFNKRFVCFLKDCNIYKILISLQDKQHNKS